MRHLLAVLVAAVFLAGCQKPAPVAPAPAAPAVTVAAAPAAEPGPADAYAGRTRQFLTAAEKGQISLLLDLLGKGADVNDKDEAGETALHRAAAAGQRSAVLVLLTRGADLAGKDSQGRTAAMRAAEEGHAETLVVLIRPDEAAKLAGDALQGAAAQAAQALGGKAAVNLAERLSGAFKTSQEATDRLGQTALMKAAAHGHVDCVRLFLDGRGDLRTCDREGRSALHLAAREGHAAVIDALFSLPGSSGLSVADVRKGDSSGKTALELAEAGGHRAAAAALRRGLLLAGAREGNVPAVRQALEGPGAADLPVERAVAAAARVGATAVARHLMEGYRDRPAEDKLRLLGAFDPEAPSLHLAVRGDHRATAEAMLDLAWWKDKQALADYLSRRDSSRQTPLEAANANYPDYGIHPKPEIAALITKRLEEVKQAVK
jgi:ankyrin repeat protein